MNSGARYFMTDINIGQLYCWFIHICLNEIQKKAYFANLVIARFKFFNLCFC